MTAPDFVVTVFERRGRRLRPVGMRRRTQGHQKKRPASRAANE